MSILGEYMNVASVSLRVFFIVIIFHLVACSTGKIVKTYEGGDLAPEKVAVLSAGENISLISVNGQPMARYLLSSINVNYGLKPGNNKVVFQYESIWGTSKKVDGRRYSEKVTSTPKEMLINAKAGDHYTFSYINPSNVREARTMAAEFTATIFDQNNEFVVKSGEPSMQKGTVVQGPPASEEGSVTLLSSKNKSTLDALKALWGGATSDDKKGFLVWALKE